MPRNVPTHGRGGYQPRPPHSPSRQDGRHSSAIDTSKIIFGAKIDPKLYSDIAEATAKDVAKDCGRDQNKPTQLRRFYDEIVMLQAKVGSSTERFEQHLPFIQMLKAKVAYAEGRKKVDANFAALLRRVVDEARDAASLKQARVFMEAFMAFYKVYRPKSRQGANQMELKLIKIQKLQGCLELRSGLRIGASEGEIRIGGVDNQVIRHPHTDHPYIPGSSLKGKVRSLLEWLSGAVEPDPLSYKHIDNAALVKPILQLFGMGGGDKLDNKQASELGPTRLAFWDAPLNKKWREEVEDDNNLLIEVKTENRIDRIRGVAKDPRQTERVPAGAKFDFTVSIKVLNIDSLDGKDLRTVLYRGLRLLELDSLGGSGSRGYGKVKFSNLRLDETDVQADFEAVDPFAA